MKINGNTLLVGVLADPIAHIKTPEVLNHSAASQGLNVACLPFHVLPENLLKTLDGLKGLNNLAGIVVTIPYKEEVVQLCDQLTETAKLVGSVNALRVDPVSGELVGGNFDGGGMVAGIKGQGHSLKGKRVLLVGAGGAGKSIAFSVAQEKPAELSIYNRSMARGTALVERIQGLFPDVRVTSGSDNPRGYDVVINATSLGLKDDDALPLDVEYLDPGTLVCEVVVRQGETRLLTLARERGGIVHHGQHMLYGQILQISQFFGIDLQPEHVARILGP